MKAIDSDWSQSNTELMENNEMLCLSLLVLPANLNVTSEELVCVWFLNLSGWEAWEKKGVGANMDKEMFNYNSIWQEDIHTSNKYINKYISIDFRINIQTLLYILENGNRSEDIDSCLMKLMVLLCNPKPKDEVNMNINRCCLITKHLVWISQLNNTI